MVTIEPSTTARIKAAVEEAQRILVIAHINPDGDALGSLTAVGLALQQLGKQHCLVCDDGMLERFRFLALADEVQTAPDDNPYDLIISVDCGDMSRMGRAYSTLPEPIPPLINIDHHITNTHFGDINLVESEATSTAEILYALLPHLGVNLTADLATSLLTGLVTDTLCFRIVSVTSYTLGAASKLMEAGADLADITTRSLLLKPLSSLQLWKKGLNNLRLEDGLLWTSITNEERLATGYPGAGTTGLVNALADVYQADMGAVLMEMEDGRVSVSFRCRPPFTVSELALNLGGGGHDLAAGCTLDGPLSKAEELVVAMSKEAIARQKAYLKSNGYY